jgi:hypothetical protein
MLSSGELLLEPALPAKMLLLWLEAEDVAPPVSSCGQQAQPKLCSALQALSERDIGRR